MAGSHATVRGGVAAGQDQKAQPSRPWGTLALGSWAVSIFATGLVDERFFHKR